MSRSASGALTRQELVERRGGSLERRVLARPGVQARQRSTWSRYGIDSPALTRASVSARDQLEVEPVAAIGLRDLGGEPRPEGERVLGEARRRAQRLHVDAGLELGGPEVAIDGPGQVLVEPEAEEEVVARDVVGRRDVARAADGRDAGRASPLEPRVARRRAGCRRPASPCSGGRPPGLVEPALHVGIERGSIRRVVSADVAVVA